MSAVVLSSLVAVVGTLSGGVLAGVVQARVARVARRETRCDVRRAEALAAVTGLVSALADHRRAMWVREDLWLSGAGAQATAAARATSHGIRSAVAGPLVTVEILTPTLAPLAQQATEATYALRGAADPSTLAALRDQAIQASDRLVTAAGQFFAEGPRAGDRLTAVPERTSR